MLDALQGDGSPEDMFSGLLEELMGREVLEEPMMELRTKFPAWLESNTGTLDVEQRRLHEKQLTYIRDICAIFETEKDDKKAGAEFRKLMELLQDLGPLPTDLMK